VPFSLPREASPRSRASIARTRNAKSVQSHQLTIIGQRPSSMILARGGLVWLSRDGERSEIFTPGVRFIRQEGIMNLPILLALAGLAGLEHSDASEAFSRLRLLQGTWRGTYTWTGARTESGKMTATYRLTGNGSALIEDLGVDEQPSMTSAYHLDKGDLRMT